MTWRRDIEMKAGESKHQQTNERVSRRAERLQNCAKPGGGIRGESTSKASGGAQRQSIRRRACSGSIWRPAGLKARCEDLGKQRFIANSSTAGAAASHMLSPASLSRSLHRSS